MGRIPRVVVPGLWHYVSQFGNRGQKVFSSTEQYEEYKSLLREACAWNDVEVVAYCLLPSGIRFVVVPSDACGLSAAIKEVQRNYSRWLNRRLKCGGHLWRGRYSSFAFEERYLPLVVKWIERQPVAKGVVKTVDEYRWSSARARLKNEKDDLVKKQRAFWGRSDDWKRYLRTSVKEEERKLLEAHERSGRPLGGEAFLSRLEEKLRRSLRSGTPGRRKNVKPCSY